MIGGRVARETILIARAPLVDDGRGNETRDWDNAVPAVSHGWAVDTGGTQDDPINRDGASVAYVLRGPFDAPVDKDDHVSVLGGVFKIDGAPLRQPGVSPLTSHTILRLVAWEG